MPSNPIAPTPDEHKPDCKHGKCGSCGVTMHPWCFEPADKPTPPAPTADDVRKATRRQQEWLDAEFPEHDNNVDCTREDRDDIRTILAALDRAQGEVERLKSVIEASGKYTGIAGILGIAHGKQHKAEHERDQLSADLEKAQDKITNLNATLILQSEHNNLAFCILRAELANAKSNIDDLCRNMKAVMDDLAASRERENKCRDALFAAICAINDAEICMPDEILDYTSKLSD